MSGIDIKSNTISVANGVGILVLGASATVEQNNISNIVFNADDGFGDGIAFADGADVIAVNNTIENCATNGILYLDGGNGEVRDNTLNNNGQYGILEICSGAANSVTVGTNQFSGNSSGDLSLCSP